MRAEQGPPADESRFVLVRFDWNPEIGFLEQNYGEVQRSRSVAWPAGMPLPKRRPDMDRYRPKGPDDSPPGGERVCMVFCNDPHFRTRLTKMGWLEVTDAWKRTHAPDAVPTVEPVAIGLAVPVTAVIPPGAARAARAGGVPAPA